MSIATIFCAARHGGKTFAVNAARRRRSIDPTHTTLIRRQFDAEIARRFKALRRSIAVTVDHNDAFGLRVNDPAGAFAFAFPRSADKVTAFMEWLALEQARLIFDLSTGAPLHSAAQFQWANVYIDSAYRRGLRQAANELRSAGATVSDNWIETGFQRPVHADRAGLIYTRTYSELRGITEAMDTAISRELAAGLIDGRGPRSIARDLAERVDKIGITRARVLARTETIAAHADATLNTYREAGLEGVTVVAEFATAGDDKVCPRCRELEGRTFRIDEADGVIPVHPNCRCAWIPVVEDGTGIALQ